MGFQSGNTGVHGDFLIDNVKVREEAFVQGPGCDFDGGGCGLSDINLVLAYLCCRRSPIG